MTTPTLPPPRRRKQQPQLLASLLLLLLLFISGAAAAAAFIPNPNPPTLARPHRPLAMPAANTMMMDERSSSSSSSSSDHPVNQQRKKRVVEFYSGIGGWAAALEGCGAAAGFEVAAALEINTVANEVYTYNSQRKAAAVGAAIKPTARLIESLTAGELDGEGDSPFGQAALWVLSPPCQPYTRNNKTAKRDTADPRAASFLRLCALLAEMQSPPTFIALENVEGFEASDSCRRWLAVLNARGYETLQCVLSPTMFGWPNERPRYYCLAARAHPDGAGRAHGLVRDDLAALLLLDSSDNDGVVGVGSMMIRNYLDGDALAPGKWEKLHVSAATLAKPSAWCFDIVSPASTRSACFTKAYGKFIKGTGSVLYQRFDGQEEEEVILQPPEQRTYEAAHDWQPRFIRPGVSGLRYFSPTEVARLMHFPGDFAFPPALSPRKCYELLGNSLHVGIASQLLRCLLPTTNTNNTNHESASAVSKEGSSSQASALASTAAAASGDEQQGVLTPQFARACALAPVVDVGVDV